MPAEFKAAYRQFVAGGWTQLGASPEFGGQGMPLVLGTAVDEMWASANLAFKLCPMLTKGAVEALEQTALTNKNTLISRKWSAASGRAP
jgi:acyl-CoA dehydrogenase